VNSIAKARRALIVAQEAATALDLHLAWLGLMQATPNELRYRSDQLRAPRGTRIGGQWIDDPRTGKPVPKGPANALPSLFVEPAPAVVTLVSGRRLGAACDGFSAGCQNGGSFGTSAIIHLEAGRRLCWDCAVKWFGLENESEGQKWKTLTDFDPTLSTRYPK
jgi:hypothetical protein